MTVLALASSSVFLCLCCLLITMSLHVITMSLPKLVDEREETERVKKNQSRMSDSAVAQSHHAKSRPTLFHMAFVCVNSP